MHKLMCQFPEFRLWIQFVLQLILPGGVDSYSLQYHAIHR